MRLSGQTRSPTYQSFAREAIKAECVGVVWAEFMTTSSDFLPTSKFNVTMKAEWAALLKGWGLGEH